MAAHGKLTTLEDIPESTMLLKVTHVLPRHPGLTRADSRTTLACPARQYRQRCVRYGSAALSRSVSAAGRGPRWGGLPRACRSSDLRHLRSDSRSRTRSYERESSTSPDGRSRRHGYRSRGWRASAVSRQGGNARPLPHRSTSEGGEQVLGLGVAVPAPINGDGNIVEDAGLSQLAGVDLIRDCSAGRASR